MSVIFFPFLLIYAHYKHTLRVCVCVHFYVQLSEKEVNEALAEHRNRSQKRNIRRPQLFIVLINYNYYNSI